MKKHDKAGGQAYEDYLRDLEERAYIETELSKLKKAKASEVSQTLILGLIIAFVALCLVVAYSLATISETVNF